jgi:hypothetical protein
MNITVELPDQVARQWGETPDAVSLYFREDAAIEGYLHPSAGVCPLTSRCTRQIRQLS